MTRSFQIAALTLTLLAGVAHAEPARLAYNPADLASAASQETLKTRIAATADAYCRGHAVGGTIAGCRQEIAAQFESLLKARATDYAKAQSAKPSQLANR